MSERTPELERTPPPRRTRPAPRPPPAPEKPAAHPPAQENATEELTQRIPPTLRRSGARCQKNPALRTETRLIPPSCPRQARRTVRSDALTPDRAPRVEGNARMPSSLSLEGRPFARAFRAKRTTDPSTVSPEALAADGGPART